MPNPSPNTEGLTPFEQVGDRPLARKVIGTRYAVEVYEVLTAMPSDEMQALIRSAVEEKLRAMGILGK